MILDGLDGFDCEIYIPDVDKLQMNGNTIILPEEVGGDPRCKEVGRCKDLARCKITVRYMFNPVDLL